MDYVGVFRRVSVVICVANKIDWMIRSWLFEDWDRCWTMGFGYHLVYIAEYHTDLHDLTEGTVGSWKLALHKAIDKHMRGMSPITSAVPRHGNSPPPPKQVHMNVGHMRLQFSKPDYLRGPVGGMLLRKFEVSI